MSLSSNRILRRLTSLVAAIALMSAVVAPSAAACEPGHGIETESIPVAAGTHHESGTAADCTEPGPGTGEHDPDCLAQCVSIAGCSTPCFVPGQTSSFQLALRDATPSNVTPSHSTRSFAPDRPPPRP